MQKFRRERARQKIKDKLNPILDKKKTMIGANLFRERSFLLVKVLQKNKETSAMNQKRKD